MSVQEIKKELAALSKPERAEVAAFLFHLRHADDDDYQEAIARRLKDRDPSHWLTVEQFEERLKRK